MLSSQPANKLVSQLCLHPSGTVRLRSGSLLQPLLHGNDCVVIRDFRIVEYFGPDLCNLTRELTQHKEITTFRCWQVTRMAAVKSRSFPAKPQIKLK